MRRSPLRLLRLANPIVRLVLRSPAHGLLSSRLLLLTYRGRRSGRPFTIPILYARLDNTVITLAARPERKQWWRAFRSASRADLLIAGRQAPHAGRLLSGEEAVDALRAYLARFPRASGALGATAADAEASLVGAASLVALVAFEER